MTTATLSTQSPHRPSGRSARPSSSRPADPAPGLRLVAPSSPGARPARTVTPRNGRPTAPSRGSGSRSAPAEPVMHGGVKSVVAALDVLDCFADSPELGVSDIARRLGVAKSTAHRLLTSLCARQLVERNPESGQYRLGLRLFELGQLTAKRMRLHNASQPLLEELRQLSGCTVQLAIADGPDVLFIAQLETLSGIRILSSAPRRLPAHCTAAGKAIAAFNPVVARARRTAGFDPLTDSSITSVVQFDRALEEVRRKGIALNLEESRVGVGSVAAPILDSAGRARAAVSLVRPIDEMTGDLGRTARLAGVAARRLARTLAM